MKINEVFEANDEYTRDELLEIYSNLLFYTGSLTNILIENKVELLHCSDYDESIELSDTIHSVEIALTSINRLCESIFNFLYKGEYKE